MKQKLIAMAMVLVLFGMAGPAFSKSQTTLTWVAGSAGGGWYGMAGGMATIIKEAYPDIVIKVVPGGGIKNPAVIGTKSVEMGWSLPFTNAAAIKGLAPYGKPMQGLRSLMGGMALNILHFYIAADSKYNTMDEVFSGKCPTRLAITQPGSSDRWVFEQILNAYGTDTKKMKKAGYHFALGSYAYQASAFKDGNVDGAWNFQAIPGASVTEASIGRELKLVNFSDKAMALVKSFDLTEMYIPAGTYPKAANGDKEIRTAAAASVITVHKDMSEDLAYRITKALMDNLDKMRALHASLKSFEPEMAVTGIGAPLHPGAKRYYKEVGILK